MEAKQIQASELENSWTIVFCVKGLLRKWFLWALFVCVCIWLYTVFSSPSRGQLHHIPFKRINDGLRTDSSNLSSNIGRNKSITTSEWQKSPSSQLKSKQEMRFSHLGTASHHDLSTSNITNCTVIKKLKRPLHYITVNFMGRLGNLLFQYASMYGLSKSNNLITAVPESLMLNNVFRISAKTFSEVSFHTDRKYVERKGCVFEKEAMEIGDNQNVTLFGYFQSWKYFQDWEADIRKDLRFRKSIRLAGENLFKKLTSQIHANSQIMYVGVHVRRGDMAHDHHLINYGYNTADMEYLEVAMGYFVNKYKHVVFLIASDDMKWCEQNIHNDVIFIPGSTNAVVVMSTMIHCNHTIMTVGSFGWWVAWLTGGETTYFKDYPKLNSRLYSLFRSEDYRLPNWIPL